MNVILIQSRLKVVRLDAALLKSNIVFQQGKDPVTLLCIKFIKLMEESNKGPVRFHDQMFQSKLCGRMVFKLLE